MVVDSTILTELKRYKGSKYIVSIELVSGEDLTGKVVEICSDYIVVAITTDFHYDGFAYLKFNKISRFQNSESSSFYSKLFNDYCKSEVGRFDYPSNYSKLLAALTQSEKLYIFELDEELHLGKLNNYDKTNLDIEPISSTGEAMGEFRIELDEVLFIKSDSEYIKAFEYHLNRS